METAHELVDVLVIGAGFAGLSAAKQYLHCAPATNLVIVDYVRRLLTAPSLILIVADKVALYRADTR